MSPSIATHPTDSGWAWVVLLATLGTQFLCGALVFSVGIAYSSFLAKFRPDTVSFLAMTGALYSSFFCLGAPPASVIINRYGCRTCCVLGGFFLGVGFTSSAFVTSTTQLFFTYGLLAGFGIGLIYSASNITIGFYFKKKLGLAAGISNSFAAVGILTGPVVFHALLDEYSIGGCFLIVGAVSLHACFFGMFLRPTAYEGRRMEIDVTQPEEEGAGQLPEIETARQLSWKSAQKETVELLEVKGPEKSRKLSKKSALEESIEFSGVEKSGKLSENSGQEETIELPEVKSRKLSELEKSGQSEKSVREETLDHSKVKSDKLPGNSSQEKSGQPSEPDNSAQDEDRLLSERDTVGQLSQKSTEDRNRPMSKAENPSAISHQRDVNDLADFTSITSLSHTSSKTSLQNQNTEVNPSKFKYGEFFNAHSQVNVKENEATETEDGVAKVDIRKNEERPLLSMKDHSQILHDSEAGESENGSNRSIASDKDVVRKKGMLYTCLGSYMDVLMDKAFILHCCSLFGLNIHVSGVSLHLPEYVQANGTSMAQSSRLFIAIGLACLVSKLSCGFAVSDPNIDPLTMSIGLMGLCGIVTCLFPLYSETYVEQMAFSTVLGLYYGGLYAIVTPLLLRFVDRSKLSHAYSISNFFSGLGFLAGPVLAALIVDSGWSYSHSFVFMGLTISFAAVLDLLAAACLHSVRVMDDVTDDVP